MSIKVEYVKNSSGILSPTYNLSETEQGETPTDLFQTSANSLKDVIIHTYKNKVL